jgi:hypothetical protein
VVSLTNSSVATWALDSPRPIFRWMASRRPTRCRIRVSHANSRADHFNLDEYVFAAAEASGFLLKACLLPTCSQSSARRQAERPPSDLLRLKLSRAEEPAQEIVDVTEPETYEGIQIITVERDVMTESIRAELDVPCLDTEVGRAEADIPRRGPSRHW